MVVSVFGTSRAIFALCSLIAVQGGVAAAGAPSDIGTCLTNAGIENSMPTTATWTTDTEAWNSRVTPVPSAVAYPKSEEEVSAALKCAADAGVKVTTLGGNRSFSSMGFGRNDGALIMNLKYMTHLEYDETTQLLSYGGSVMISEAATYMWSNFSRALPHGRCPDVGMTGVAASGFGTLSRASGTVLDNIESVRVALANGSIVDADATQNADLFWGVRGAASSMGVVLDFKIKTLEPPSLRVTNYTIAFNKSYKPTQQDNVDALIGTQTWALSKDNNDLVSIRFGLNTASVLKGFFYGSSEEATTVLGSIVKNLPASMVLTTNESDFWTSEDFATPGLMKETLSPRRYFYIASVTIPSATPLDNSTAWELFSNTVYAPKLPDAKASGFVDIWGGEYAKGVTADASAWKHDDNLHLVRWDIRSSAFNVSFADSSITTLRGNFYQFVDAYKASGGVPGGFTTYRDEKWTVPEMAEYLYGGGNFDKLQKIKTEYDPSEMFNTDPQAIPALA